MPQAGQKFPKGIISPHFQQTCEETGSTCGDEVEVEGEGEGEGEGVAIAFFIERGFGVVYPVNLPRAETLSTPQFWQVSPLPNSSPHLLHFMTQVVLL